MRVMALSSWWPEPADNGSRLRIAHLLRALAQEHEIHLIAFAQESVQDEQVARLSSTCASVRAIPQRPWVPRRSAAFASLWQTEPASVRATHSPEFVQAVREQAARVRPDFVIAFQIAVAPYVRYIPRTPRLLDELEVMVLREQYFGAVDTRRRLRAGLTWWKHCQYLRRLLVDFDGCTVVSTIEQELVRGIASASIPVVVIPNGADTVGCKQSTSEPDADSLIYPGALSFDANYDAMKYFISEIFPLIRRERPSVRLRITGRVEPMQRDALHRDGVEFTGYVPDIRSLIARTWGEVVPLRIGGGTRLKVLEALALGTPVVSTSKGIEGLQLQPGRHVLVADTPGDFAAATVRLLRERQLRSELAAAGREVVRDKYDWRVIGGQLRLFSHELSMPGRSRA